VADGGAGGGGVGRGRAEQSRSGGYATCLAPALPASRQREDVRQYQAGAGPKRVCSSAASDHRDSGILGVRLGPEMRPAGEVKGENSSPSSTALMPPAASSLPPAGHVSAPGGHSLGLSQMRQPPSCTAASAGSCAAALPPHPLLAARSNGGSGTTTPTARTNSMPPLQGVAQKKREPGHTTEEAAEEQRRRLEQAARVCSRCRPRPDELPHDDGPLSAEDARARAHKHQRLETGEEAARRGMSVGDVPSDPGSGTMCSVNGEGRKPVLVKAESPAESQEALAAAALMQLAQHTTKRPRLGKRPGPTPHPSHVLGPSRVLGGMPPHAYGQHVASFAAGPAGSSVAHMFPEKGPGGGGKSKKANWNEWQRAILDEEYAVNRNPSRETVERIVERLSHALDYRQASSF